MHSGVSSIVSRCGPDLTAGPRREMSARKILSGLTMAVLSGGYLVADAASWCSPASSEVDVEDA